jgi:hypothetical protein
MIQLLNPTCLGGFFAEYRLSRHGMVSAPMSTRFTRSKASPFSIRSAENQDGSEMPRYSKPKRVCYCSGWIRLPSHVYITDTPVTPGSLCSLIIPSRSSIWLMSWHGIVHSPRILSASAVLFGKWGLMVSNIEPPPPPPRQTSREFVGGILLFHSLSQLEPGTTDFIHGTLVGLCLRWKR